MRAKSQVKSSTVSISEFGYRLGPDRRRGMIMVAPLPGFRTALLQSWWGVPLIAWLPQAGYSQVDLADMTPRESDSLFVYASVGRTRPAHPHDFTEGWEDGLNLRLAFLYLPDGYWGGALALEHTGFIAPTGPFNPEIRLISIIPSLTWTIRSRWLAPYGQVGVGLLSQGTRRVRSALHRLCGRHGQPAAVRC